MKSRLAIAGHPVHPMLVPLPIGLFVWAALASVIYAFTDSDMTWYEISYWSAIAGIVAGLVAAAAGLVDGLTIGRQSDARESVLTHMTLNVVVVVLFLVSVFLMRDRGATGGSDLAWVIILQLIAVALLGMSGWIGGEIVYRHHISMIPEDGDVATQEQRRHRLHGGERGAVGR